MSSNSLSNLNRIIRNLSRSGAGGQYALAEGYNIYNKIDAILQQSNRLNFSAGSGSSLAQTSITFTSVTSTSFAVNWTAVAGASRYDLGIGTSSTGSDSVIQYSGALLGANLSNIAPLTLTPGVTYYITIVARSTTGSTSTTIAPITIPAASPTLLGGSLVAWYDATDQASLTLSGSLVTQWNDKSGNAHHLTSAGGNRPTNHANGGSNNKAYIEFNNLFITMSVALAQPNPFGYFFVMQLLTPITELNYVIVFTSHLYDNAFVTRITSYNGVSRQYIGFANNAQYAAPVVNSLDLNWAAYQNQQNGVNSFLDKNNGDADTGGGAVGSNAGTVITLGDPNVKVPFRISELIAYSGVLTNTQNLAIRSYLLNKYAINSLSTNPVTPPYLPIVGFGDSITYGQMADSTMDDFLGLIAWSKGLKVVNFGYPGSLVYTAADPTINFTTQVNQGLVPAYKNGYVFIQYGSNDSQSAYTSVWADQLKAGIQRLIDFGYAKSRIVLGTQPYQPTNRPQGINYVNGARQVAADLGIPFYDAWTYMGAHGGESLLTDGIHPNTAGHQVYADGLLPYVV